jgi:DNA mismatch repair ATPase MutL
MHFLRATSTAALVLLFGTIVPAYAQHEQPNEKRAQPEKQQSKPQQAARPSAQPQKHQQAQQAPKQQPKPQVAHQTPKQQPHQQVAHQAPKQQPKQQVAHQAPKQQPKQQVAHQAPTQQPKQQPHQQTQQAQQTKGHPTQPQAVAWQKQQGWLKQGGGWQAHSSWQQDGDRNWAADHRTWAQRGGYGGYYIPQNTYNLSFGSQHFFRMQGQPVIYMGYPRFSYDGFSFLLVDPWPSSWAANWYDTDDVYIDYAGGGYYLCNRSYPSFRLAITVEL